MMHFYPRPPRGGRQRILRNRPVVDDISIHALREEGDVGLLEERLDVLISIHALREEGDASSRKRHPARSDFYPRPPRGGRHGAEAAGKETNHISIHALREEGDYGKYEGSTELQDFYPRPPRGGRRRSSESCPKASEFLSTPSARRATAKTETKSLFSYKLYNILHEFRRALFYNGAKNYPNHAK